MNTTTRIYIIIAILAALWCAGFLAAPLLKAEGYNHSAESLYFAFAHICHQHDAHSFHLEGEKFGVCIRCSAIYFGFFAGLLIVPLFGIRKKYRLPSAPLLILTFLPTVLDVLLNNTGLHISTTLTRVVSGALLGFTLQWWIIPLCIDAILQLIQRKKIHIPDSGECTYVRETQ